MEDEQQEATNLCFMVLEDNYKVPLLSNSSCDNFCDYDYDDDEQLDDESSIMSKIVLKCKNLLLKKKFYKLDF